jgi:hypothetical protein
VNVHHNKNKAANMVSASFAFDPNFCAKDLSGRMLTLTFTKNATEPVAIFAQIMVQQTTTAAICGSLMPCFVKRTYNIDGRFIKEP